MKAQTKEQQQTTPASGRPEKSSGAVNDRNGGDDQRWLDSLEFILEYVLKNQGTDQAPLVLSKLSKRLREAGVKLPSTVSTPYVNTIPPEEEPPYPGNRDLERRIKSLIRWNAMAMVVNANREHAGLGGHISTYASCATLYEVGYNHFFHGGDGERPGDGEYRRGCGTGYRDQQQYGVERIQYHV